jgi:hypothetical protein
MAWLVAPAKARPTTISLVPHDAAAGVGPGLVLEDRTAAVTAAGRVDAVGVAVRIAEHEVLVPVPGDVPVDERTAVDVVQVDRARLVVAAVTRRDDLLARRREHETDPSESEQPNQGDL